MCPDPLSTSSYFGWTHCAAISGPLDIGSPGVISARPYHFNAISPWLDKISYTICILVQHYSFLLVFPYRTEVMWLILESSLLCPSCELFKIKHCISFCQICFLFFFAAPAWITKEELKMFLPEFMSAGTGHPEFLCQCQVQSNN